MNAHDRESNRNLVKKIDETFEDDGFTISFRTEKKNKLDPN